MSTLVFMRARLEKFKEHIRKVSIKWALKEQKLKDIYHELCTIVSDISDQYSSFRIDNDYLKLKVRAQHSFQMSLLKEAIDFLSKDLKEENEITIVDIGDSAGTHIAYAKGLMRDRNLRCISVNLDAKAVEKIRKKGFEAICAKAEDIASMDIDADIFLSFEMLEHLSDPCVFLSNLSLKGNCKYFIVTVPYVKKSRVGLHHIRQGLKKKVNPENTHLYEFSPEDWKLIFKHCGWSVEKERIYLQYPRKTCLSSLMVKYWKKNDFEGFYGVILKRDPYWRDMYNGWQ